jgi:hypothetical protein
MIGRDYTPCEVTPVEFAETQVAQYPNRNERTFSTPYGRLSIISIFS